MTRFPVTALRSVNIGTPDLALSERFYTSTWGLDVVARTEDTVYLRASGTDHHVLALHSSDRPKILSVTFRAASADDLPMIADNVVRHGAQILSGPGPNEGPDGGTILTIREPQGGILRFVHGDRQHPTGEEVADRPFRLAHVNLNSTDVDAETAFYEKALGFRLTDRSKMMAFLRCNSDHHAVVLAEAKANGLNHVAFLLPDWESVMRASGRMIDAGYPIAWGVGRHGPGDNVFAYFIDPVGFVIEYTAEVLQVDDTYSVRGPDEWVWPPGRTDHWGIAPPKAEYVKAAQTAITYTAAAPSQNAHEIHTPPGRSSRVTPSSNKSPNAYQVVVVGFGPAGAVATSLLGSHGIRTLTIDRLRTVYDKPRAIAIDHEILRLFDNLGVADRVLPYVAPFPASQHFGAEGQLIRRIDMVPEPYPLGYTPSMVFTQPPVEEALRDHAASYGTVEVSLGTELLNLEQSEAAVTLSLRSDDGRTRTVTADYVIACDGASSGVREQLGITLEDLVFDEPWLVVDVLVNEEALGKLPQTAAQYCDPARPTTFIIGPGNHRRWEIMLLPDEDPREVQQPDQVWKLLSKWLTPDDATLWRAASYRFHALVAQEWRRGRVFLAGDAAHQQPPFIGQGMCQGLRDVSNLIWKLDRVLKRQSNDALLNTYEEERSEHVRQLTTRIKAIGKVICERDPEAARERDARILAEGGGQPRTITRQEIVPPLQKGLLAPQDNGAKGTLFPQPWVQTQSGPKLLDAVVGAGWRLAVDGRHSPDFSETIWMNAEDLGMHVISVGASSDTPSGIDRDAQDIVIERDDVLARWFDAHGCHAAIVRPDHYVFGTASDEATLIELLADLQTRLRPSAAGSLHPDHSPVSLHARTAS